MRRLTIYDALRQKLGREPSNAEVRADVERIKREAYVEVASRGGLPHQRRRSRGRGFGSSAAEHQTRGERADKYAVDSAEYATREANDGRCRFALKALEDAFVRLGERNAEARGAGHGVIEPLRDRATMTVERAKTAFLQHCVVPRRGA